MRYEGISAVAKRHEDPLTLPKLGLYSSPSIAERLVGSEQAVYRDILFLRFQAYVIASA